jgi:hypothetical protein
VIDHNNHRWAKEFAKWCQEKRLLSQYHDLDHDWKRIVEKLMPKQTNTFPVNGSMRTHLITHHGVPPEVILLLTGDQDEKDLHDALCMLQEKTWQAARKRLGLI